LIFALTAGGLLAACANSAPASFAPAAPIQAAARPNTAAESPLAKARGGRVLYIADLDGQPGVGQIHVYSAGMKNPQQLRLITNGAGRPFGLWVDAKNDLYVANQTDKYPASVTAFKAGASSPFFTITNLQGQPGSVAVDSAGNVYVNENVGDEGYVQIFAPGSTTPKATLDTGVGGYAFNPGSMAFDPQGNLFVAEQAKLALQIVELAPGASQFTPANIDLTNITGPGMGIDKAGNMYVASSESATVSVFAPGQAEPSRTISSVGAYGLTWVTPRGAVYQASGEYTVAEIAPGANSPTQTISCTCSAQGVAVSR
jgi:sugar lactone lactonase YvrE